MATRPSAKARASSIKGSAKALPTAALDPATLALTAKGIYEAAKAGVDLSVRLYEATKGDLALVCAVLDSQTTTTPGRFRVRLLLSSLCPHGVVVNSVTIGSPKGVPVEIFLLRPATSRIGWNDDSPQTDLSPPLAGKTAMQTASPFLIPPLRAQEIVVEVERAAVLARIYNKRGGTIVVSYDVLGDNGDPRDLRVEVLFRDDQPLVAGFFAPSA